MIRRCHSVDINSILIKSTKWISKKTMGKLKYLIILVCWCLVTSSCSLDQQKTSIIKDCVLPQDQVGTLSGRWANVPVPLAIQIQQNGFTNDELAALTKAADTWNTFSFSSLNFQVLNYGKADSLVQTDAPKPQSLCSQTLIQEKHFVGSVMVYKDNDWPYPLIPNAIALTSFCPKPAKPLPEIFMAIMEINFDNFFKSGKKQPDLQSIFLHELGHLLGLNHSCEVRQKEGVPNCNGAQDEYKESVMFPIINFDLRGVGEKKQALKDNDQGRANCLYKDLAEIKIAR